MSSDPASPSGSSDHSLPTFNGPRDTSTGSVQAESSASGSPRTRRSDPQSKENPESVLDRASSAHQTKTSYKNGPGNHEALTSTKNRNSSAFLLDSTNAPSRLAFPSRSKTDALDVKGKAKRDGSGLIITKRRNRHSHRSSIGSSPLATKVSALEDDADVRTGSLAQDGSDTHRSGVSGSISTNSPTLQGGSQTVASTSEPTPVGYDTDPMQIVILALSLSAGRRRQISGMRIAYGEPGIRRSTSTAHSSYARAARPQSSLGHYLQSERQFSRNISPQAQGHGQTTPLKTYEKPTEAAGTHLQPFTTEEAYFDLQDDLHDVSDATFNRVQKAKDHFELLYEHRRILAHLPPLRGSSLAVRKLDGEGRAYNPLQYARNRKVRFQEKKPVERNAEGWHDVQQVRAWVNAIIEGHTELRNEPDECIRLPELPPHHTEAHQENKDPMEVDSASSRPRKRDVDQISKPRRPRSDWVVSPGDLLADVYWLEQGLNKTKIEDRDGNKTYPWNTELRYTGWRNRTPAQGQGPQQSSRPPEAEENSKPAFSGPAALPELPTFTSTSRKGKLRGRARRRETKPKTDSGSETSDSESQKKRKRLRSTLIRSLSWSSTSDSDDEKSSRTQAKAGKRGIEESAAESGALDHNIQKMLDRDARHSPRSLAAEKPRRSADRSRSTTKNHFRHRSRITSSRERASSKKRRDSDNLLESLRNSLDKRRHSRPSLDAERPGRASLDYDTTAHSSPSPHHFPSIAINLSPPPSRSPSPTKKVLPSRINPFRDRNQSKQRNGIDAADFAEVQPLPSLQQTTSETDKESSLLNLGSRDTSPMTKQHARRTSETSITRGDSQRTHSTTSKTSAKTPNSPDAASRIRGIFKGGRIAELVGNEVSRVGDFIWKREPPSTTRTSSSASSAESQHGSDTEEEPQANGSLLKRLPQPHSKRLSSSIEGTGKNVSSGPLRTALDAGDNPSYFMSNLPSFTSPFQKDREVQEERGRAALLGPDSAPPHARGGLDHISMAAAHHRSLSKSPRLDRLAPPKLNISRSNSPVNSHDGRRGSYDLGKALSFPRPASASRGLNHALGPSQADPPVTGLTGLKASSSGADLSKNWDPSARDASTERASTIVTKKDIARARALLLSSGAKARQISLRAHSIRPQPPQFLLDTLESPTLETLDSLRVPRKEEHSLAARNLISTLTIQSATFRKSLEHFTSTTCPSLHTSLQALDDLVENTLTPRVRAAADESGELSMKLTTTSTLAVKGLNDAVEAAMRRRRRGPLRWLRRFGYGIVEWLVVGLLWGIWGVVSLFRVVVAVGTGIYKAARWLFWLD